MRPMRMVHGQARVVVAAARREAPHTARWVLAFLALSSLLLYAEVRSEVARLAQMKTGSSSSHETPVEASRVAPDRS